MPTKEQAKAFQIVITNASEASKSMLENIGINPEIFARVALNAALQNPNILECSTASIRLAVLQCAQRGILPDGESAAIVPRRGQKAALLMGYKGMVDVARRQLKGMVHRVEAVVKTDKPETSDEFVYEEGDQPKLYHKPNPERPRPTEQNVIAVYSVVWLPGNTQPDLCVMFRSDIDYIRATYAHDSGPAWTKEWAEQAKKTVVRRHFKRLPIRSGLLSSADDSDVPDIVTAQPDDQPTAAAKPAGGDPAKKPVELAPTPAPADSRWEENPYMDADPPDDAGQTQELKQGYPGF